MIPVQDDMSRWLSLVVQSFGMEPDSPCSPRIGVVTFNGPPIGCSFRSTNPACRQFFPYYEWVERLVDEPTAEAELLLERISSRSRAGDMTCISCGLEVAGQILRDNQREGALPGMIILMTDGRQTAGGTDASAIYR